MDYSYVNTQLWVFIVQFGIIAALLLFANLLRRKVPFIRKSLMPTAVLAGFILLILRTLGILDMSLATMEAVTYHTLAMGFIAMSLRVPEKNSSGGGAIGAKSGALIVSTYLVQAITGLVISLALAYTVRPDFFKASGILLPMAYGQGPGQANNVGGTYEALGMVGGRTFGLSLAAAGYLCACIVGVIYLNVFDRKKMLKRGSDRSQVSGSVTVDDFQAQDEIPVAESVDKFSVQVAMVVLGYLITYLISWGITAGLAAVAPGLANTISPLIWGFNFIVGSVVAMGMRGGMGFLRKKGIMHRQYQNNYLLSRISGLAFDLMIVTGIASIDIYDLKGMWMPFLLMAVAGGIVTFIYLRYMCDRLYPEYSYEGFFSMYGMLTGTLSSGVLLLREIDPRLETPAANNLVVGSSFGIIFGAPMLILISLAARNDLMVWLSFGLIVIYLAALLLFLFKFKGKKKKKD